MRKHVLAFVVLAAACSAHDASVRRAAVATPIPTFVHAGFTAGPVVFTDASGHLLEERRYEPFGTPIGNPDLVARDLNALNKRTDVATGWSDHGARWLAPETGRWQSPDPIIVGPDAKLMAKPWALHPYQYGDQNPTLYWDPDGREPQPTQPITIDCRSCNVDANGMLVLPETSEQHSTVDEIVDVAETRVSPFVTIQAGKWSLLEKAVEEAKPVAGVLDKTSIVLSGALALFHVVKYSYADTQEERNEHAGGAFLGAASMYSPVGVAIAVLTLIDPHINKHVGTPIDLDGMGRELARQQRDEDARAQAARLPAAKNWHDTIVEDTKH